MARDRNRREATALIGLAVFGIMAAPMWAAMPDHPIITEVYNNPPGKYDGPVGRDAGNAHQEFIEIYLPTLAELNPTLSARADALNLTLYEVEGDRSSSGNTLVNWRFDLPTFNLTGVGPGLPRPANGVVVLGWVDYQNSGNDAGTCEITFAPCSVAAQDCANPSNDCIPPAPTALAGLPGTRVNLVNSGAPPAGAYTFIAINGHHFGGTTNFPTLLAESLIDLPKEASSGVLQNGSGAYLLVDRDAAGYVELYDDKDPAHQPPLPNANPALDAGNVLLTSCLLDAFAGNDDGGFDVTLQPTAFNGGIDLDEVLGAPSVPPAIPPDGVYSLLIAQIAEEDASRETPSLGGGYARRYIDVAKTTETLATDNPAADALSVYRLVRNNGPFDPTPGTVVFTTSDPALGVSDMSYNVLAGTTASPRLVTANVGGSASIDISVVGISSTNTSAADFGAGTTASAIAGHSFGFPTLEITSPITAGHDDSTLIIARVSATGAPSIGGTPQDAEVVATVMKPTQSIGPPPLNEAFQATVFAAIQGVPDVVGVANEFLNTDLGAYLQADPDICDLDTLWSPAFPFDPCLVNPVMDPLRDLRLTSTISLISSFPRDGEECLNWHNPPGGPNGLNLYQTVTGSAEFLRVISTPPLPAPPVLSSTYVGSVNTVLCPVGVPPVDVSTDVVKALRLNIPDTQTYGGTFSPSEQVHFMDARGTLGVVGDTLVNVTTERTFEIALIDLAVRGNQIPPHQGNLESGETDDFGIVVEVSAVEAWATEVGVGDLVFLSYLGGLQGEDIDSLNAPPGGNVATIIYLDLDNLHDTLGVSVIEAIYLIDTDNDATQSDGREAEIIEAFSLNLAPPPCVAPAISVQPVTQSVCEGDAVALSVSTSAGTSLSYQWRLGGFDIPGATSTSYVINPASLADDGNYDVVITNPCGSATSSAATLTVLSTTSIATQPAGQTLCEGAMAVFNVTTSGTVPSGYQWRLNGVDLVEGGSIAGSTTDTLAINPVALADAGAYDVVITSVCGVTGSTPAILAVQAAPAITAQPAPQSACDSTLATFSVGATGTAPLFYQWRLSGFDLVDGGNVAGATTDTLVINPASAGDVGNYDVVVTNTCGSTTSATVSLVIASGTTIALQPVDQTVCEGMLATFTLTTAGAPVASYQWRLGAVDLVDGGNISGATTDTLVIDPVGAGDLATDYNCVVTSACGAGATSNNAALATMICGQFAVEAIGMHYLSIAIEPTGLDVALLVTGDPGDPNVSCLALWVQANGSLDVTPIEQSPATWGTIAVGDVEIIGDTTYQVQTVSALGSSAPASATTWLWGDVDHDLVAGLSDLLCLLDRLGGGSPVDCTVFSADLAGPDGGVALADLLTMLDALGGGDSPDVPPCP